ncbi:ArsR/SmtB family transcription factor [Streptosporangium sp. NBC_01756]|uniref:ArsR/SmtB family transcription factor n=1 Tax=Streptosporangium sp. NBC_01756 TaxID=2975950 RepID=UPI002DD89BDE|nr:metalloregulator ArsR/SmtB family transcription factor [Streptosporangium sp. NBC_01756]WSC87936.1 metalloregulator ArsR/SmtB family transcription factor [Streptosporangium sp. NBC_01756]
MDASEYHWLPQPDLDTIEVGTVLQALADPVRLQIVRALDTAGESTCTALDVPVKVSTVSHHLRSLRECGVVSTRLVGNARPSRLRRDDLERRFPGLLTSILNATPPSPAA